MSERRPTFEERLANPKLRASIPTSKLPPRLRKLRALNKRLNAPVVEGSPVTNRDAARDRDAQVALRYGPVTSQLAQRQTNNTNWFQTYKDDVVRANQAFQGVNAQAIGDIQNRGAQQAQASEALRARLDAEARADAASRGASYSGQPGAQAAAGANVNQALSGLSADLLRGLGAAYGGHIAQQGLVGSAAQLSERLKTQKALEDLEREKGAFGQTYLEQVRDDEAKRVLERAAFDLDTAEFVESTKPKPASPSDLKTQQQVDFFDKHGYYPPTGAPKKTKVKKVKEPESARKDKGLIRTGAARVAARDNGTEGYYEDAYRTLVETDGIDPVLARAMVQGAKYGRLGNVTKRRLRDDYGIRTLEFSKPRPRARTYTPNQTGRPTPGLD